MKKLAVKLNEPIYIGVTILDEAKRIMMNHHYNYRVPRYSHKVQLAYTDTDTFIYEIETFDVYNDMKQDGQYFDMSGYKPDNSRFGQFYDATNHKVLDKFKDECANKVITHVICPKPKVYCIRS
jgi:hypothetical protein